MTAATSVDNVAWDLEPLLKTSELEGVEAFLASATADVEALEAYRGRLGELDAGELATFFDKVASFNDKLGRVGNYASLQFAVATDDPEVGALMQKVQEQGTVLGSRLIFIELELAELHGEQCAARLARFGLVPLVAAILLTLFVLRLPTDPGMYEPAKEAFPVILGQSWRMMVAGIVAYAVSLTLNIWIFSRLQRADGRFVGLRGFVAAALSQIVDTVVFITISFYGVRPIAAIMAGQMTAKVVLSAVLVPAVIWLVVKAGRRMDAG